MLDKIEGPAMRMILGGVLIFLSFYFSFFKRNFRDIYVPLLAGCLAQDRSVELCMF